MPGSALTASFTAIPSGIDGVRATLRHMVAICRSFLKPPTGNSAKVQDLLLVRVTAQQIVQSCDEKDWYCEAECLQVWVRDNIRYVRDMLTSETLQTPDKTLKLASGDCDDKAMLYCALASCIGFDTRFCAIGVDDSDEFSHVSAQVLVPGTGWCNAETIPIDNRGSKAKFGWFPPECTCLMLAHI